LPSESVWLEAGGLRVNFIRQADRYRHEIVEASGESIRPWLASIEGGADDAWPLSPPLQELHIERRGEHTRVALLVGRAGRSHWSMSVEADGELGALTFDVACRCTAPPDLLGSSYRLAGPNMEVQNEADNLDNLIRCSAYELQVVEGSRQLSESADDRILRIAAGPVLSPALQTVRWKYCVRPRPY
jgi:hypothetical protein